MREKIRKLLKKRARFKDITSEELDAIVESRVEEVEAITSGKDTVIIERIDAAPSKNEVVISDDDLTRISGIGAGIQKKLHEAGYTTFEQIAALTDDDIEMIDEQLKFKGRIIRDDWIGQATELIQG